jgi:hypothetical protein
LLLQEFAQLGVQPGHPRHVVVLTLQQELAHAVETRDPALGEHGRQLAQKGPPVPYGRPPEILELLPDGRIGGAAFAVFDDGHAGKQLQRRFPQQVRGEVSFQWVACVVGAAVQLGQR